MRILLTGGNGMVGKNLLDHPSSKGYKIQAPTSKELNLLDLQAVHKYLKQYQPDIVIHAAGIVGGIQANIREPVKFLLENSDIGRNIIWASKENRVKTLLNLGSSCMYPRDAENPLKEDMILKGELEPTNEGYALAKIYASKLCEYISKENPDYHYKTLIPCNIYGPYDKFDPKNSHMVPAIIHKLHQAKSNSIPSVEIWGDGLARREFMYAADLADCIWKAVSDFESLPSVMNIGIGKDFSVNEYYNISSEIIGCDVDFVHDLSKPVGMRQKLVDTSLATKWGWEAKTSLREGIKQTYQYYLKEFTCG